MAFNSFLQLFTPKDRVFYSLFEEVADGVARMGKLMKEVVAEPDFDKRAAITSQVEDQEHINDDLTHRIFTELGRPRRSIFTGSIPTTPVSRKWPI
jgi:hypothetical protein